jgi:hypothetical protein
MAYKRALLIRERHLGDEHPDLCIILRALGKLYKATGNSKAVKLIRKRLKAIRAANKPAQK